VKTVNDKVVRHSLTCLSVQKYFWDLRPLNVNFVPKWITRWLGSGIIALEIGRVLYLYRNDDIGADFSFST